MQDNKNKTKKQSAYASLKGARRAVPVVLFALAVFTALCFIIPSGVGLGKYIGGFLLGLFSVGGYLVPALMAIHAFFYPSDVRKKRAVGRFVFTAILLLAFSALLHAVKTFGTDMSFSPKQFYNDGKELSGGGFFGGIVGYALIKLLGPVGLIIFAALIFALYIVYFIANGKSTIARAALAILNKISHIDEKRKKKKARAEKAKLEKIEEEKKARISPKHKSLYDDEFFSVDNGMSELKIAELGILETRTRSESEKFPHLETKVKHESCEKSDAQIFPPEESYDYESQDFTPKDDVVYEEPIQENVIDDDSADAFFAKEFDPFDFEKSAKDAAKQSQRAREAASIITEYAEPLIKKPKFSDEEIRAAQLRDDKRRREREEAEALERRKALEEEEARTARLRAILKENEEEAARRKPVYTQYSDAPIAKEPIPAEEINEAPVYSDAPTYEIREMPLYKEDEPKESFTESFAAAEEPAKDPVYREYNIPEAPVLTEKSDEEESPEDLLEIVREPLVSEAAYEEIFDDEEEDINEELFEIGEAEDEDSYEALEIPEEERNPDIEAYRGMFTIFNEGDKPKESVVVTDTSPLTPETEEAERVPFDVPNTVSAANPAPKSEKKEDNAPDYSDYKMPSLELLKKGNIEVDENINDEITKNGEKLIDTLAQFNVKASIRSVDVGPRITRYEVVPAKGVRVNSVINLFDDISLNLAAEGIRMEAPIPGKSAIGVEIPNKHPQTVFLRDLLETDEFKSASSPTMACFGKDVTGNPVLGDIAKMPHMLIAGATGMGKSVCINALMISMLFRARPDELKFIMIDPKMVEFSAYKGIPHLLIPVITEVKQAAGALMWAVEQMEKRYELFVEFDVKKLDDYNRKVRENPERGKPLPKIIIVIDELNDLMMQTRKPVEDLIMRITQKARAAGIHLIIGTQRPSVDVVTGVIKANIPSRLSCKVSSYQDSKTILDQAGAEKLLNNGDMLFWPVGKPKPTRVQGAFVSDDEVADIMSYLKKQSKGSCYDEQALAEINSAAQKCTKGGKSSDDFDDDDGDDASGGYFNDPQFLKALELAVNQGKIATSLIQRKIGIGYGKAAKFIDIMEEQGFVSEQNGQKAREVLITKDELQEILSRRSLD